MESDAAVQAEEGHMVRMRPTPTNIVTRVRELDIDRAP
jgi:hypothetical protein